MTKYHFEVYDDQGILIYTSCNGSATSFEYAGFTVKRFWDGVELGEKNNG